MIIIDTDIYACILLPQYTRYIDRVYIPHKTTRDLLRQYATKGLSTEDYSLLKQYLDSLVPEILPLLNSTTLNPIPPASKFLCKPSVKNVMHSLAASTAVCGLLHPSEEVNKLVEDMCTKDVTLHAECLASLQQQIPVIFKAIREENAYHQNEYGPLMRKLLLKCYAPFETVDFDQSLQSNSEADIPQNEPLLYFPHLKKRRVRGNYVADGKLKEPVCTKRSSKHPTLLPGIFTLFCEHGEWHFIESNNNNTERTTINFNNNWSI